MSGDNNTLVFVPTVDEFWLGTNADDNGTNSVAYYYEIGGDYWRFQDNVSFQYDSGSSAGTWITESWSADLEANERTGILHRDTLDPGTLTITFTSWDGQYSHSYEYDIPGGPTTQVDTHIPSPPYDHHKVNAINDELLSQNLESGILLAGAGNMLLSTIEVADGSVWFFEPANTDTADVRVELYGVSDETWQTITLVSADQGQSVYMPEGDYLMVTYSTGGDYQILMYYQPTNVVAGSPLMQSPVEVYDTWGYQEVKTYPIYLSGKKDWQLKFLEANNNQYLNFCIRYAGDSTMGCPSEEHSGSRSGMTLDSTESVFLLAGMG